MRKILIFLSTLLIGCCPCRHMDIPASQDSVRVEVVERIVWEERDVELPQESQEVTTVADSSYLESSVAASWVIVNQDGSLFHSLFNKPSFSTSIPITRRDSTIYHQSYRKVIVEVEAPDTWWEQTQKKGFNTMLVAFLILIILRLIKSRINIF